MRQGIVTTLALILGMLGCGNPPDPADLVLTNGTVITLDSTLPQAEAVAVRGDRIIAVGTVEQLSPYIGSETHVLNVEGRMIVPGFIEGHAHFMDLGEQKLNLDLTLADSWEEIVSMVEREAGKREQGEWIVGRGWHQEKWSQLPESNVQGLPLHTALSLVSPENPVILTHASGHGLLANARAMEEAGITSSTPNPPGGEIVRDSSGNPIGFFRETAQSLIEIAYQQSRKDRSASEIRDERLRIIDLATRECLSKGITSFQDAGAPFEIVDLYKELAANGSLSVRLYVMLGEANESLAERVSDYRMVGFGNSALTVRAVKRYMDGALGSHGAWLLEPYEDLPESRGLNTVPPEEIAETARIALQNDLQLCVHAIGDRANREVLDIYAQTFQTNPQKQELRWRIEHAQHIHPQDIPRFGELEVIAAMQGIHATSDGSWVPTRIGTERARQGAYVWRSLIDSGAIVINGTDAPVEDVNPILSYYASVSRRLKDGTRFFPEQVMTREEALRSYTLDAAFAAFEEDLKGSLTPGKLADIVVLSKNLLTIEEERIPETTVDYTIIGGRIAFSRNPM